MNPGRFITALFLLFTAAVLPAQQKKHFKYYQVNRETEISGTLQHIHREPCYHNRTFIILTMSFSDNRSLRIEAAPEWFFKLNLKKGDLLTVRGSLFSDNRKNLLIARWIRSGQSEQHLRDSTGFPLWQGGRHRGSGRRKRNRQ